MRCCTTMPFPDDESINITYVQTVGKYNRNALDGRTMKNILPHKYFQGTGIIFPHILPPKSSTLLDITRLLWTLNSNSNVNLI